jgi:hypothetical protein
MFMDWKTQKLNKWFWVRSIEQKYRLTELEYRSNKIIQNGAKRKRFLYIPEKKVRDAEASCMKWERWKKRAEAISAQIITKNVPNLMKVIDLMNPVIPRQDK